MLYLVRLTSDQLAEMQQRHSRMLLEGNAHLWGADSLTWELWQMASRLLESHKDVSRRLGAVEAQEAGTYLWNYIEGGQPAPSAGRQERSAV